MHYKTLIINLDSCADRLLHIKTQCDRLGLSFERVPAVLGANLSITEKSKVYDLKSNLKKYDKPLNDGEIGCYLSHINCWKKIIEDDLDFALILEDDAILTDDLIQCIEKLKSTSNDWDYIKLSQGSKRKKDYDTLALTDSLTLARCRKLPSTATGQLISKQGAIKLLNSALPISRPVDTDIQYWFEKQLRCFVVRPVPILNGDFGSEINAVADRRQVERRPIRRLIQKISYEIRLLYHVKNMPNYPKKFL
ncbi:MAG: glycosyltransferase family 25 protein [Parashewanella sp.]